jgi:seryl-tRNA synthetase
MNREKLRQYVADMLHCESELGKLTAWHQEKMREQNEMAEGIAEMARDVSRLIARAQELLSEVSSDPADYWKHGPIDQDDDVH